MKDTSEADARGKFAVDNGRLDRGGVAWSIFEGGRDPFIILIIIYIFMPYVAGTMIGDPVRGQETISRWQQWAGWAVMATAPFIGASIAVLVVYYTSNATGQSAVANPARIH